MIAGVSLDGVMREFAIGTESVSSLFRKTQPHPSLILEKFLALETQSSDSMRTLPFSASEIVRAKNRSKP
jgi:hypothetical protein